MDEEKKPGYCVLSRKPDEKLYLIPRDAKGKEDVLEIMVVDIRGDRVRLGTKAPDNYVILRAELVPQGDLGKYVSSGQFLAESKKARGRET